MVKACVFQTTCCALNDHQPDMVARDAASLRRFFGREFGRKRERERSSHRIFNESSKGEKKSATKPRWVSCLHVGLIGGILLLAPAYIERIFSCLRAANPQNLVF